MSELYCPICKKEYEANPRVCDCGFEGLEYPTYEGRRLSEEYRRRRLFGIYKFAKRVLLGEIEYAPSKYSYVSYQGRVLVDCVNEKRGLALIDPVCEEWQGSETDQGVLAFKTDIPALIVNTELVQSLFLDESRVEALLIGKRVKYFRDGILLALSPVRYIYAHSENPLFHSENNILFNMDRTRLICYAPYKPEEEYRIPSSVKVLAAYSFYFPKYLKRLYIPRGTELEQSAITMRPEHPFEIIYE